MYLEYTVELTNSAKIMKKITEQFCFGVLMFLFIGFVQATENPFKKYYYYANLSSAAYMDKRDIVKIVEESGETLIHYDVIPAIEVGYFLTMNKSNKKQTLVVRGTANVENAVVDAAHKLVTNNMLEIKLHEGFSTAAQKIYHAVKPHLLPNFTISTTGHSLGGAVAVILSMKLQQNKFLLADTVTFGQPKVTNISGVSQFESINVIRLVTPKDLVPLVPPFDAMDVNNLDIYWHLGTEIILFPGEEYAEIRGLKSMLRATDIVSDRIDERNIAHHQMSLYLQLIEEKIGNARLVPYKNSLDILNIFNRK